MIHKHQKMSLNIAVMNRNRRKKLEKRKMEAFLLWYNNMTIANISHVLNLKTSLNFLNKLEIMFELI